MAGSTAAESGIAEIRDAIQQRLDKATAQGEIDANQLDRQITEALEGDELDSQLAERMSRLGLE